ncbi:MAG: acylneuraminate cytidylyltransferase family protein [Bacteroidota bacterium]
MNKIKVLAIIPAREGSKRVQKKNFRPFAGTTLSNLAIEQAKASTLIDKIVVNSDSIEVLSIAKTYREIFTLERPKLLAQDESPAIEYMLQTVNELEKNGEYFDLIVIIQPSSPLRSGKDIDQTIQLLIDNYDASSAVSVVKLSHMVHPHKLKVMNGITLDPFLINEGQATAAHELPDIYVRNCAVYVFKTENLKKGVTYGHQCIGFEMPEETSVDINEMIEFKFAEYLFMNK